MNAKLLLGLSALLFSSTANAQNATVPCMAKFYITGGKCGTYASTACVDVTGNYMNSDTDNSPRTVQVDLFSYSSGKAIASEPITIKGQQVQGNQAFQLTTAFPLALWQNTVTDGMPVSCAFTKFNPK